MRLWQTSSNKKTRAYATAGLAAATHAGDRGSGGACPPLFRRNAPAAPGQSLECCFRQFVYLNGGKFSSMVLLPFFTS